MFCVIRRILTQTAVAVEKDDALRQTNEMCNVLKTTMQEFADAETVKQELCYARRALTAKIRKVKALSAETNVKDREIKAKDTDLKQLRRDLCNKKEILLREKRDKQKLKNQLDTIKSNILGGALERPMSNPMPFKTAGAGFRFQSASVFE